MLIFIFILILVAIFTLIFTHRIATGTDKPTLEHKKKGLDFVKRYIFTDEDITVIRHIITGISDHIIVLKSSTGYYEITLRGINGYEKYIYSITNLSTIKDNTTK